MTGRRWAEAGVAAGGIVPRRTEGVGIGGQDGGFVVEDNMATSGRG